MPELLLQSALAASRSTQFATEAAQIRTNCHAQHGDTNSLISCPQCYEAVLEAFRARYLGFKPRPTAGSPAADQQPQQQQQQQQQNQEQQREWFASRRAFLSDLDDLISSAKEYQVSPQAVDDRVREERSRWYAERVRASLLRLVVEDPSSRAAVFEKLEDLSSASALGADPVRLAREVAEILSRGPLAAERGTGDLPGKLAAATDGAGSAEVLRDAFFVAEDGTVPADHQKYLDMLLRQGLSMEQVVDRILEERQAAAGAKEQAAKLSQRLDELRRARAAHEAQKSRKAQRRESLALQKVPDELYDLPACAVCGGAPSTRDYFCCSICTILADRGIQQRQTLFCSAKCEENGHASHAGTHTCASSSGCIRPHANFPSNPTDDQDTHMDEAPPSPNDLRFCTECLGSLKQPTIWCSLACAEANFRTHREDVHLAERKKRGLEDVDDDVADIRALTTSLSEAVKEWEERNRVRLQPLA
ncbi:uncharacterized protein THITE_2111602 [Thermothielavioides terrestris NRRL 8126]|uniref:Suppressor of anucleate metulae protein B n=1 Tax=Thermothielavioides terrestris (strain ATCC 38088 / NRRL 8126) TaxID=578455 RepID=G2R2T9_THETT|nr:uncharacterized protein THITE_2111602 [Thermothielavioides terrestris NRRL 8126]AEO65050.1 hypothetical protein THITE_2111602 [Thermothielavioides terrestris NRRL 8126]